LSIQSSQKLVIYFLNFINIAYYFLFFDKCCMFFARFYSLFSFFACFVFLFSVLSVLKQKSAHFHEHFSNLLFFSEFQ